MKILNFNTGRPYTPEGQPITAIYFENERVIAFADHGRNITGLFRDTSAGDLNQRSIMAMYDNNDYQQEYDLDDRKLTDLAKLLKGE